MNTETLSFSIVICTYNRDEFLERTLRSLNHLLYSNFEVVVVNGPSTDRTLEILEQYAHKIKIASNPVANLSISRNIGIAAASGEVIAFLDDDAIPEPNWLQQIKEVYESKSIIGGAGGRVYGPGSDHFQFHNGFINVWGEAEVKLDYPGKYTSPDGDKFNIMMGVNSTFNRQALIAVGGFDEYYEYFHDESDLCVRLTKSGYPIYHHQEAFVHHEFARSHIRKSIYNLNWYPIVKNTVYFGVKNSKGLKSLFKRIVCPYLTARKRVLEFKQWRRDGNITKTDYSSFMKMWRRGIWRGYIDGFFKTRPLRFDMIQQDSFLTFQKEFVSDIDPAIINKDVALKQNSCTLDEKFGICLLSKYYPPFGSGGVATYTRALAEGLVSQGHPVFVLTSHVPGGEQEINGVHVKEVALINEYSELNYMGSEFPITRHNISYSLRVFEEVERLYKLGLIKIVETPLWDYEGLASVNLDGIKTVVRLETPLRKAAETQGWKWNSDLELSAQLEKKLIEKADGIITISQNVKKTIGDLYVLNWSDHKTNLVPLGLIKSDQINDLFLYPRQESSEINILFVGRLEPRKGIDILLKAFVNVIKNYKNVNLRIAGNNMIPFNKNLTIQQIFEKDYPPEIQKQVHFLGEVSDELLQTLYQECDFFVAPSRYESFGLVYLEAMRYGKAVIGTRTGGVPEVILEGRTGLLVDPESVDQLYGAIVSLIENQELSLELGRNGLQRLKEVFSVETMTENTLKAYRELMN